MRTVQRERRRWSPLLLAAALGCTLVFSALLLTGCGGDDDDGDVPVIELANDTPVPTTEDGSPAPVGFRGGKINPPVPKPDFVLTGDDGQPFDILADTEGQVTLVYVGYTYCPDICPTHMAVLAAALERLTPEEREQITVLFATADPRRDTPEVLDGYLAQFDPAFIGLTGSEEQMAGFVGFLGLPPTEYTEVDEAGNYEVGHASFIIAYDRETNLGHLAYPSGYSTEAIASDLALLVNEGWDEAS